MRDNLSIVITIIILVMIIIIFPLYNYFERQDDMSYNIVLTDTTEFVEDVLNKGYIDQDMYSKYIADIAVTGNGYDIQLEAHKKILTTDPDDPNSNSGAPADKQSYAQQYKIDYTSDILDQASPNTTSTSSITMSGTIIKNNVYYLNKGDEFYIKVTNKNTTMAGAIFNAIVSTSKKDRITVNYGGVVKNELWKKTDPSDIYTPPANVGVSTLTGPFYDPNSSTQQDTVYFGNTIIFLANNFNIKGVKLNGFDADSSDISWSKNNNSTDPTGDYIITIKNIKSKDGTTNPIDDAYITVDGGVSQYTMDSKHFKIKKADKTTYGKGSYTITLDYSGYYALELYGASGGGNDPNFITLGSRGGFGGHSYCKLYLESGDILKINVGGQGRLVTDADNGAGYNGGGGGSHDAAYGYGGGGCTYVAINNITNLILVAGGGGGADNTTNEITGETGIGRGDDGSGGSGGGNAGGNGYTSGSPASDIPGGTQYTGYARLQGGPSRTTADGGGGGGGYYGGIGGNTNNSRRFRRFRIY